MYEIQTTMYQNKQYNVQSKNMLGYQITPLHRPPDHHPDRRHDLVLMVMSQMGLPHRHLLLEYLSVQQTTVVSHALPKSSNIG